MSEYFRKFPTINYNDQAAINMFARVTMRESLQQEQTIFLPLTIQEGERADMVANDYYGDPYYSWLIYYANDVIDPLYDYPLNQQDLEASIKKKYGSLELAQSTIVLYQLKEDPGIIINSESYLNQETPADWWPVTGYNYELYLNDLKTNKYIIRRDLAATISEELEKKLNE